MGSGEKNMVLLQQQPMPPASTSVQAELQQAQQLQVQSVHHQQQQQQQQQQLSHHQTNIIVPSVTHNVQAPSSSQPTLVHVTENNLTTTIDMSNPALQQHGNLPIIVSQPQDIQAEIQNLQSQTVGGIKTLQVGQVLQTVTGPQGQQILQIPQHDLQHMQTAQQLAQLAQTVQQQQQQQQQQQAQQAQYQTAIPVTIIRAPLTHDLIAQAQHEISTPIKPIQTKTEPKSESVSQLAKSPVISKTQGSAQEPEEILRECKERFLKMSEENRKEYLNWMVWRLTDTEVDLMETKLEKKRRLKTRKGKKRQTGAKGEKINVCKFCPKSFRKKTHLTVHERIHTGEKPYVCHICDKSFAQSTGLKTHIMKHTVGETPFSCSICGKKVTTKGNLKLHEKLHTGERPFPCPHCDKAFPRKSALNRHLWIHSGERPFQCTYCTKNFRRKTDLETHERIHTGVKPFVCKFCGKAFSDQRNYKAHERKHSGAMNCSTCGRGPFQKMKDLRNHMLSHGMEPQQQVVTAQPAAATTLVINNPADPASSINVITNTLPVSSASIPTTNKDQQPQQQQLDTNNLQAAIMAVSCQFCNKPFKEAQHLEAHIATAHMDAQVAQIEAQVNQQLQYPTTNSYTGPILQVQPFNT